MLKENVMCENLSYAVGGKNLFTNISLSLGNEKTGLVGANGVGKTTLLRLMIGELTPQTGVVHLNGNIGYMPQNFVVNENQTIAQVFGIDQKIAALERMNSGSGDQHDFEIVGDDWRVAERAQELLHRCGLGELALSRQIKTLSGGQTTRVLFARLLMKKSDFLILDEPTNNLDSESRCALYDVIKNFDGGILIVSHDRQLLALMDQIIELSPLGIKTYGGNYTDYVEQKRVEQEALEQDLVDAQKQLHKTKKTVQLSKERYDQRASRGKKKGREGGVPKIVLGAMKEHAEKTKSKLESRTDKQLEAASDKLAEAQAKLEQKELLDFELEATRVHNTKLVLEIQNLTFAYPEHAPILSDFNMTLIGPKRVAIEGKNGSGKTTLLKLIMGQLMPTRGTIKIGVNQCAYLDQALSVLNSNQTILENFKRLNPHVQETDCRLRLAAFLFAHNDALKRVDNLSGGEKMRAALACVLMGNTPPQLILLDEPTNNMDLESIASIERALRSYKGALLVISHDVTFLQNIGVEEKIELTGV
jgi:ATPase subunit of ABC transporter with duplicated ATPase domains